VTGRAGLSWEAARVADYDQQARRLYTAKTRIL
jgi:hypothetical protein